MRHLLKTAAILGGVSVSLVGASAQAGGCGYGAQGPNCQAAVIMHPGVAPSVDPMHMYSVGPMGHLRSVRFLNTPSVNIMRVHGMGPTVQLSDVPNGYTSGCFPESTGYCRQTVAQRPVAMPMSVRPAPVATQQVVHVGGGYDASKFTPRTYGSNVLTPGIAHIPTSIVDRSYENAQAVLNSGMTRPQPVVSGGMAPHPSMMQSGMAHSSMGSSHMMGSSHASSTIVAHGSIAPIAPAAPQMNMHHMSGGHHMGVVTQSVRMAPETNVYPGSMSSDGTYYEKVSGPTTMGGAQATQVICKREAPVVNVERQVVGVPAPVCVNSHAPLFEMPQMAGQRRYGH